MPPALRSRTPALDAACADAVDLARAAAVETAGGDGSVGESLGREADGERTVSHFFASTDAGYRGWRWCVTVARASRSRQVTVSEVTLLPGGEAVVAPAWVPWDERVQPGDLGPGDLLPVPADDERLQPGYTETGQDADLATWWEPGLGRVRVLSEEGRALAADRWHEGEHGPSSAMAQQAPAACATCGFFLPLAGSLRQAFGVCANEMVPDDGTVVSLDHGCGGHSEATIRTPDHPVEHGPLIDEENFDDLGLTLPAPDTGNAASADAESADADPASGVALPAAAAVAATGSDVPGDQDAGVPAADTGPPAVPARIEPPAVWTTDATIGPRLGRVAALGSPGTAPGDVPPAAGDVTGLAPVRVEGSADGDTVPPAADADGDARS